MKKFENFYFKSFDFDVSSLIASFHYSFDNEVFFCEQIDFSNKWFLMRDTIDSDIVNNILFHIHIALWISYYKAYPTQELIIETGKLDDNQILFWKKFYTNGLWEFLYKNNIDPKNLFTFVNASQNEYKKTDFVSSDKSLVAIWWWKDSIVTSELLKEAWVDFDVCVFWKIDALKEQTAQISQKNIFHVQRKISQSLFDLNEQWYYNWHVPITWIIAFVFELAMYLYDYKYMILSNERSANFGNFSWKSIEVNHQYSKSLEFEQDFWNYVENYISSSQKYFSILRWLYEVKIAKIFALIWKQYFSNFSSCNKNFKILSNNTTAKNKKNWCNSCPKCVFVFSILRPYLSESEMLQIFWEDLFQRNDLEQLFKELLWITGNKPFECVWESEEVMFSLHKSLNKYENNPLPYILKMYYETIGKNMSEDEIKKSEKKLERIYNDDIIPSNFKQIILNADW